MIPSTNGFLQSDFVVAEQPNFTHKMDLEKHNIRGYTDGKNAIKQAIYCILNTERFQYVIYSWNYGIELTDLYSEPMSYVIPEVKRRISEALMQDTRIESVDNFDFEIDGHKLAVTFTAHTILGDVDAQKEVMI